MDAINKGQAPLTGLLAAIEGEAKSAGASRVTIRGSAVVNEKLGNSALISKLAKGFGYEYKKLNNNDFEITKALDPAPTQINPAPSNAKDNTTTIPAPTNSGNENQQQNNGE
jgi:hypothetical protein